MCFEWDERYFREKREMEEKLAKQQVDELIRNAENTAKTNPIVSAFKRLVRQSSERREDELI